MPRSDFRYDQTVIGDCGHQCAGWPQVSGIGSPPEVICDECTRAKYGISEDEEIAVWVRVAPPKEPKPKRRKAKKESPQPPQASMWDRFM